MYELGKREECFGMELLQPLNVNAYGGCKPEFRPQVPEGHAIVCGFDQGLGERMIVCETFEDMTELHSKYSMGYALRIKWYSGPDPGFITVL
jgi:hypothetical protein